MTASSSPVQRRIIFATSFMVCISASVIVLFLPGEAQKISPALGQSGMFAIISSAAAFVLAACRGLRLILMAIWLSIIGCALAVGLTFGFYRGEQILYRIYGHIFPIYSKINTDRTEIISRSDWADGCHIRLIHIASFDFDKSKDENTSKIIEDVVSSETGSILDIDRISKSIISVLWCDQQ